MHIQLKQRPLHGVIVPAARDMIGFGGDLSVAPQWSSTSIWVQVDRVDEGYAKILAALTSFL
jgi:hypothetical protein